MTIFRIEHSVVVDRPAKDVFVYLTEPANLPEWQLGVLEASSNGPVQEGSTITELRKFLGMRIESTLSVTVHEPHSRFALRVISGPAVFEVTHRLSPNNGGSRLDVVVEAKSRGFPQLAEPVVQRALRRELELDFATLKDLLEARG